MNELENTNLHEHTIRRSIVMLLFKGGFAWLLLALADFIFDVFPKLLEKINLGLSVDSELLNTYQPYYHLLFNVLFGWLLLYVTFSWVFEYYIIKPDSVVVRRGIFFSHENVYLINDIKTIEVIQGFWGKIFKIGTVDFWAHRAQKRVYLRHINNPNKIAADIHALHQNPENAILSLSNID